MVSSTPQGHTCPDLLWKPSKAGKIWECWSLWPIVGGVRNGAAEEDWPWDLNLGAAAIEGEDHAVLTKKREDHKVLGKKGEDHAALAE